MSLRDTKTKRKVSRNDLLVKANNCGADKSRTRSQSVEANHETEQSQRNAKLPKKLRNDLEHALVALCDVWFEEIKPHLVRNKIKIHVPHTNTRDIHASGDFEQQHHAVSSCSHHDPGAAHHLRRKNANYVNSCASPQTASRAPSFSQQVPTCYLRPQTQWPPLAVHQVQVRHNRRNNYKAMLRNQSTQTDPSLTNYRVKFKPFKENRSNTFVQSSSLVRRSPPTNLLSRRQYVKQKKHHGLKPAPSITKEPVLSSCEMPASKGKRKDKTLRLIFNSPNQVEHPTIMHFVIGNTLGNIAVEQQSYKQQQRFTTKKNPTWR